jgi:hypothetical protein
VPTQKFRKQFPAAESLSSGLAKTTCLMFVKVRLRGFSGLETLKEPSLCETMVFCELFWKAPQNWSWYTLFDMCCDMCTTAWLTCLCTQLQNAEMCFTPPWCWRFVNHHYGTGSAGCMFSHRVFFLGTISKWKLPLWKVGTEASDWDSSPNQRPASLVLCATQNSMTPSPVPSCPSGGESSLPGP